MEVLNVGCNKCGRCYKDDPYEAIKKITWCRSCSEPIKKGESYIDFEDRKNLKISTPELKERYARYSKAIGSLCNPMHIDAQRTRHEACPPFENEKSGCFIATATYGSCDTADVMILRNFRDQILNKCRLGQAFIDKYYQYSPMIADYIKPRADLRKIIKHMIMRLIVFIISLFSSEK